MKRSVIMLAVLCIVCNVGAAPAPLHSPAVTVSADRPGWNVVRWVDNETTAYELYNIYVSQAPIRNTAAPGVVRIASQIPRGIGVWYHRPYTRDGREMTYYYAMTATRNGGSETPLSAGSTGGPVVNSTSPTMKAIYEPGFASVFSLDGDAREFRTAPYSSYTVHPEAASGTTGDLDFEATFVTDGRYLYVGAFVTDDDPSGAAGVAGAWEADALELFLGLYNAKHLAALHSAFVSDPNSCDVRISFMSDGRTQAEGWRNYTYPGMEYIVRPSESPSGYTVEVRIDLKKLAPSYSPAVGDYLPFLVAANDRDPSEGDAARSLCVTAGGAGENNCSWLRPSCLGYLEIVGRTTLEQVKADILDNPPNSGDPVERERAILALDRILQSDNSPASPYVLDFYRYMMEKVSREMKAPVYGGAAIWNTYSHSFIVKSPNVTFAFDLIDGYRGWSYSLPPDILDRLKILFISHQHMDHYDPSVVEAVLANGGYVVVPAEDSSAVGNVRMLPGEAIDLEGLHIKAYYALHGGLPARIYEVTCPGGLKIVHTGDNQTSETLPMISDIDVLLLNGWINESGTAPAVVGMRKAIDKMRPKVMIPGHIQELSHAAPTRGMTYEWAFEVDDVPLPAGTRVQVITWGERYFYAKGSEVLRLRTFPQITSVVDVPGDSGGKVRVSWAGSSYDALGSRRPVTSYSIWRKVDGPAGAFGLPPGWDYVASVPAVHDSVYNIVVLSSGDSTADRGICWSTYLVRAHTSDPAVYWESPPERGYSVADMNH